MKPFDKDEREFLQAVGLQPDQLDQLTENAPPAPADAQARIRAMARRKAGLEAAPAQPALTATPAPRRWARRWLPAAAALLLAVGGTLAVAGSPTAQAALERLLHLVPGIGITETSRETLVLSEPVTIKGGKGDLTVVALISHGERTELRFRVDGLPSVKPDPKTMDGQPLRATLILPDGSRLPMNGGQTGAGLNDVRGSIWFPALPDHVRSVMLELEPIYGMTDGYRAPLTLVDIATAGLTQPVAGGWSGQHNGVIMGAPYVAFEGDAITLNLEAVLERKGARIERIGGYAENLVTLTDNLGHSYPLLPEESSLSYGSSQGLSAAFAGPVSEGATSLQLNVPFIRVHAEGEARFRVPLSELPMGQRAELNKPVKLGDQTITVRAVTRLAHDRFALDLDLGPRQADGALLQFLTITPYRASGGSTFSLDPDGKGQGTGWEVSYTPSGRYLDLQFVRPILLIEGPWSIDLPVR